MHYLLIVAVLACGLMGALLRSAYVKNGEIGAELSTVQTELQDAKAQTASLVAASKQHAKELAGARARARQASNQVAKVADDGCLDRNIGPVLRGLLSSEVSPRASGNDRADVATRHAELPRKLRK